MFLQLMWVFKVILLLIGLIGPVVSHASCSLFKSVETRALTKPSGEFRALRITEAHDLHIDEATEAQFQSTMFQNIRTNRNFYERAIETGHPHVRFLQEIGILDGPNFTRITLEQVVRNVRKAIIDGAERARTEDILLPAQVYTDTNGNWVTVELGARIPPGWKLVEDFEPNEYFAVMMANGFYPSGQFEFSPYGGRHSSFEHDLGHIGAFVENPFLMAALRKIHKDIADDPVRLAEYGKKGYEYIRIYMPLELLTLIKSGMKTRLIEDLALPPLAEGEKFYQVEEIFYFLKAMTPDARETYLAKVHELYPVVEDPIGGIPRDIISPQGFVDKFPTLHLWFDQCLDSLYQLSRQDRGYTGNRDIRNHARFLVALHGSAQLTYLDWINGARALDLEKRKTLDVYRFVVETGIWGEKHRIYQAYANGAGKPHAHETGRRDHRIEGIVIEHPSLEKYIRNPNQISNIDPTDIKTLNALILVAKDNRIVDVEIIHELNTYVENHPELISTPEVIQNLIDVGHFLPDLVANALSKKSWASAEGVNLLLRVLRTGIRMKARATMDTSRLADVFETHVNGKFPWPIQLQYHQIAPLIRQLRNP